MLEVQKLFSHQSQINIVRSFSFDEDTLKCEFQCQEILILLKHIPVVNIELVILDETVGLRIVPFHLSHEPAKKKHKHFENILIQCIKSSKCTHLQICLIWGYKKKPEHKQQTQSRTIRKNRYILILGMILLNGTST